MLTIFYVVIGIAVLILLILGWLVYAVAIGLMKSEDYE